MSAKTINAMDLTKYALIMMVHTSADAPMVMKWKMMSAKVNFCCS